MQQHAGKKNTLEDDIEEITTFQLWSMEELVEMAGAYRRDVLISDQIKSGGENYDVDTDAESDDWGSENEELPIDTHINRDVLISDQIKSGGENYDVDTDAESDDWGSENEELPIDAHINGSEDA